MLSLKHIPFSALFLALIAAACASTPSSRPVRVLDLGAPVEGAVELVPAPPSPGGLVQRCPGDEVLATLARGDDLYYKGELDAGLKTLESAFAGLDMHPERLPSDPAQRGAVYRRLLSLYRLRAERGGDSRGLADWLALHLTDQDPSVLSVPPMVEAALSGRRDAVRARTARLSVQVRGPDEGWEVFLDGRRLGEAPLHRIEAHAGLHALEVRTSERASLVRHQHLEAGENRILIEPVLDSALVLEEGHAASVSPEAALPLRIRGAGWLAMAAGAEAAVLPESDTGDLLLVVPGRGFVRTLPDRRVDAADLRAPGRWRPWAALGLGIGAVLAGSAAAALAGVRNQEVQDLNASRFHDTRPRIRRLEAGAWGALGLTMGFSLGAGGVGLWHLLDQGHPALRDLPPVEQ